MSALVFTENKLLHLCFAKIRRYLPLKRLVKVLKFRIICFEVTLFSGCFRQPCVCKIMITYSKKLSEIGFLHFYGVFEPISCG